MGKTPFTDDYGGNAYGGRRRVRRTKHTHQSFRCDSCGTVQFLTPRELARAQRPHCIRCGGLLLETAEEAKRHKPERRRVTNSLGTYRCAACGVALGMFRAISLASHLLTAPDCIQDFVADGKVFPRVLCFDGQQRDFVLGTLYTVKLDTPPRGKPWGVMGVAVADGQIAVVSRHAHQYLANEALQQYGCLKDEPC